MRSGAPVEPTPSSAGRLADEGIGGYENHWPSLPRRTKLGLWERRGRQICRTGGAIRVSWLDRTADEGIGGYRCGHRRLNALPPPALGRFPD